MDSDPFWGLAGYRRPDAGLVGAEDRGRAGLPDRRNAEAGSVGDVADPG